MPLLWQDHSGAPGQRADKIAHRENHLKLLLAPANAPGAASDKPRINSGATHPLKTNDNAETAGNLQVGLGWNPRGLEAAPKPAGSSTFLLKQSQSQNNICHLFYNSFPNH